MRRSALVALISIMSLLACNALTGIGSYAVEEPSIDGATDDAPLDAPEAAADVDVLDAAVDGCAVVDHPARAAATCEDSAGGFGPDMAKMEYPAGVFHCIDKTEVTVLQYKQFLVDRAGDTCGQPADCAWNTGYAPAVSNDSPNLPVVNVNWCDAFMYCRWAGKNLCGTMSTLAVPPGNVARSDVRTQTVDLWYAFCVGGTGPERYRYFYSDLSSSEACQDAERALDVGDDVVDAGSVPTCHGGDAGVAADVYDMIGNAAEWEWSCQGGGRMGTCETRGGSFLNADDTGLECQSLEGYPRDAVDPTIGFRCCVE